MKEAKIKMEQLTIWLDPIAKFKIVRCLNAKTGRMGLDKSVRNIWKTNRDWLEYECNRIHKDHSRHAEIRQDEYGHQAVFVDIPKDFLMAN